MTRAIRLHLIRHGVAEELGEAWPIDAARPLSAAGARRFRRGARGLAGAGVHFDVVLTSPLLRATQTAEILADASTPRPAVVVVDSLAPGASPQALFGELAKHVKRKSLALVGHEPGMGELAARLIGLRQALPFKKGGVCRIDLDALPPSGPGVLRWLLPPALSRRLRK